MGSSSRTPSRTVPPRRRASATARSTPCGAALRSGGRTVPAVHPGALSAHRLDRLPCSRRPCGGSAWGHLRRRIDSLGLLSPRRPRGRARRHREGLLGLGRPDGDAGAGHRDRSTPRCAAVTGGGDCRGLVELVGGRHRAPLLAFLGGCGGW